MPAGQEVALQPALAGVLGEDLHAPGRAGPDARRPAGTRACHALPVAPYTAWSRLEAVSSGPTRRKSRRSPVSSITCAEQVAEDAGGLVERSRPACRRGRRSAPGAARGSSRSSRPPLACGLAPSRRSPVRNAGQDLSRPGARPRRTAPRAGRSAATPPAAAGARGSRGPRPAAPGGRARCPPPAGRRPRRARSSPSGVRSTIIGQRGRSATPSSRAARWMSGDPVQGGVHGGGHRPVHRGRVVAGDVDRFVAVAAQQVVQLRLGEAGEHGGVGDLVAVQVQDGQHRPVVDRVEELVGVPGRRQRPGLRLAVADHAGHQQTRVVERGAVGVGQRVAQLAALVDRPGRLGRDVAGHPAGEGELPEEPLHARRVPRRRPGRSRCSCPPATSSPAPPGPPCPGPHTHIASRPARLDHPVEVGVDEVQARRGAPVAEQPRLDVLRGQRLGAAADWPCR